MPHPDLFGSGVRTAGYQNKNRPYSRYLFWYHLPDVLRTDCYQAIIQISKELRIAKEYLGNGLPELGLTAS